MSVQHCEPAPPHIPPGTASGTGTGRIARILARGTPAWLLAAAMMLAPAIAQVGSPPLQDYFRETWTTRDGLPHNTINSIVQTGDGYLWFATWEGAVRYNGRRFTNFDRESGTTLPDSGIRAMRLEPDGGLLLGGSRGGLARFDGRDWQAIPPVPGLVSSVFRDSAGQLWVGTESAGLVRIDADGHRILYVAGSGLPGDSAYDITEDPNGSVWVATSGGLVRFDGDTPHALGPAQGLPDGPAFALTLDADGSLLVGTERGIFRQLDADGDDPYRFAPMDRALAGETISRLYFDRRGDLWIGTVNRGLFRLSARGVEHLGVDDGLPNDRVLALFEDREDSLWVGTNGGLFRLSDAPFTSLTRERGLAGNYVRTVLQQRGGPLWIGTSQGLSRLDGETPSTVGQGTRLQGQSVLSLADANGRSGIWVGTYDAGAMLWRDGRVEAQYTRDEGLPSNEVRALLHDRDGQVWIGTTHGLVRIGAGGMRRYTVDNGLPGDYIISLAEVAGGQVWVGTGVGLAIIEGGAVRKVPLGEVADAESIFAIHEEPETETVWLSTDRGLLRYRQRDGQLRRLGRAAGLPFDKFFHLVADAQGNYWLTGNRGVIRVSAFDAHTRADADQGSLAFELYTEADGMASAQCNGGSSPAAALHADGSVWVATALGVATVRPERLSGFSERIPPTVIERFEANGVALPLDQGQRLAAGTNRIQFGFSGLAYVMPQRIQFRYRLLGFDPDWVERGNQTLTEFTNLPPGDYVFEVTSAHPNGPWSEPARLQFSIAPFLWQRPAFWVAGALMLGLLVMVGSSLRMRQLALNEQRLKELVEQRTADLQRQTDRLLAADREKSELFEQLRQQSEAFERQAREDALTGLTNRRAFDEALAHEFARANRTGAPLCLALIDLDHFKRINDTWSHSVGDGVLRAIARLMREQCREIDLVSRWGGEEFALLLPHTTLAEARIATERLRAAVEAMSLDDLAPGMRVTVSIGVATHTGLSHHEKLLTLADAALYAAKQNGRNQVRG